MGRRYERKIKIDASPKAVFDYIAAFERHPEWAANPLEMTVTSSGPTVVGSTFTSIGKAMGTHRDEGRITEFEDARRLAFETEGDIGTVAHWFVLEPSGPETELTKGYQITRSSLFTKALSPLLPLFVPRGLEHDLAEIKKRVT